MTYLAWSDRLASKRLEVPMDWPVISSIVFVKHAAIRFVASNMAEEVDALRNIYRECAASLPVDF